MIRIFQKNKYTEKEQEQIRNVNIFFGFLLNFLLNCFWWTKLCTFYREEMGIPLAPELMMNDSFKIPIYSPYLSNINTKISMEDCQHFSEDVKTTISEILDIVVEYQTKRKDRVIQSLFTSVHILTFEKQRYLGRDIQMIQLLCSFQN